MQLWTQRDEPAPSLIIPYRDLDGMIHACQFRRSARLPENQKRYSEAESMIERAEARLSEAGTPAIL